MKTYPPAQTITALFLISVSVYLYTLNPTLFRNDSPETIAGCVTLGITHPPGYPFFNLLGKCFLPFSIGNPAFTYNFLAALLAALGACLMFLNLWTLISNTSTDSKENNLYFGPKSIACFMATLFFVFSKSYWGNAIAAKGGIYILQMVLELTFFLFLQIHFFSKIPKKSDLYFLFFIFVAGFINHWPSQALLIPPLFVVALSFTAASPKPKSENLLKNVVFGLTITIVTLSVYLYLPIRSHLYPTVNFGAPYTWDRFVKFISRTDYSKIEMMASYRETFWLNLSQKSAYISQHFLTEFHPVIYIAIIAGVFFLNKTNKKLTLFCLVLFLTVFSANLLYLQATPIEFWHIDDHLLSINWISDLLAGVGIYGFLSLLHQTTKTFKSPVFIASSISVSFFLLLTILQNFGTNNQKSEFLYYGYGTNILKSLPQSTLYFAESDYDYFSTLYLKTVLNKRPDVRLFLTFFLDQPYEREVLSKTGYPELDQIPQTKSVLHDLIQSNYKTHTIYSTFSNASFSKLYLKDFNNLRFIPSGILTKIIPDDGASPFKQSYDQLNDFWAEYLASEIATPSETQGILRQACANPFLNAAHYEKLHGHFEHWDWYYSKAIHLISDTAWLAQTWFDQAEGDTYLGENLEAEKAYQIAGYYFYQLGQIDKANLALEKIKTLSNTKSSNNLPTK